MFKNISLRIQMTILTTIILIIVAFFLTVISVYNANYHLVNPLTAIIKADATTGDATNPPYPGIEYIILDGQMDSGDNLQKVIVEAKSGYKLSAFGYMFLIIIFGSLIVYYVLGKLLNPVKQLSEEIELINEKRLSQRLVGFNTSGELQELSHSFNKMLDRLDRAFESQKRFSSDAAHELKTPLTVLKSKVDVLEMEGTHELADYKKFVHVTKKQTDRMIQLVDHLFILSAQQDYTLTDDVFLDYLFIDILEDLQHQIEDKQLVVEYEPCDITIQSNQIMLTHAFSNLVQNAIKYNHVHGKITIETMVEEECLVVKVIDTGIGIPEEKAEYIFAPFYCVDPSRSRKTGGAGLGLAITKDVINCHGGKIEYFENPKGGSIFKVSLPLPNINDLKKR